MLILENCGKALNKKDIYTFASRISRNAVAALTAIHDKGILHGDVALRNILVDKNGNVRIVDGLHFDSIGDVENESTCKAAHLLVRLLPRPRHILAEMIHEMFGTLQEI